MFFHIENLEKGGLCIAACLVYMAVLGVVSFVLGRLVPKRWFHAERWPWRCAAWETKLWTLLRVKRWQARVPDMSSLLPHLMPEKKLTRETCADLPRMLEETCVAEGTHALLCLAGLYMLRLWPGTGGAVLTLAYILPGNLPFIIIQRYNRPRLQRLLARREQHQKQQQSREKGADA